MMSVVATDSGKIVRRKLDPRTGEWEQVVRVERHLLMTAVDESRRSSGGQDLSEAYALGYASKQDLLNAVSILLQHGYDDEAVELAILLDDWEDVA